MRTVAPRPVRTVCVPDPLRSREVEQPQADRPAVLIRAGFWVNRKHEVGDAEVVPA